ncbi:PKD domain-containing protein [Algibacter pacificus]|uniref:PKD domain-containing protein n=1 Tax=Algibacter pacificus TaxID=2599389 RepID=UPI0011C7F351|nr:PKD domain-containing protein [Algibacter pacificus]
MNLKIKFEKGLGFLALVLTIINFSCQPDDLGKGNGLEATNLDAGFTITNVAEANNTYLLEANQSYITSSWDFGNGAGFTAAGTEEEVFFPDAGTYTVQHKITGIGGISAIATQNINVLTSDPVAGNLVKGGKFADANDFAEWTVLNISATGASWVFSEGHATIVASGWNQQGIYQAIDVVAGKAYEIDMLVSGNGNEDTWFEVFASAEEPIQWSDYGSNKVMGLNTWDGCGTGAFSGLLSSVGCVKNASTDAISNTVTFSTSGTIYLVIKCGGSKTPGITITNVEMRGTN